MSMRILMIHNKYGAISGEELMVQRIVEVLQSKGHNVRCYYKDSADISTMPLGAMQAFFKGIYSFSARKEISAILDEFRPDLVQIQNLYPLISHSILPEIHARNIPVVMRLANYRLVCPNGMLLTKGQVCRECLGGNEWRCIRNNCEGNLLKSIGYASRNFVARSGRFFLDNVTRYYAQTYFQRGLLVHEGIPADRIDVIQNMVDLPESLPELSSGEYMAFAGRISPEKGIATLLDSIESCRDIPLKLAGKLRDFPKQYGQLSHQIEFLGHLSGDAYNSFFRDMRALIVPSLWYEGFPGVIIEAMLHGKPVICSRIGGLPEIVDDGCSGLLFEPGNAVDLVEKISLLWANPELCRKMGAAGREKVLREYNQEVYYTRLMEVYKKATENV